MIFISPAGPIAAANASRNTAPILHWSKTREREFSDLAAMKALKQATPEQLARLDFLRDYRRKLKHHLKD